VKIVADENVDRQIVDRLREQGHEVLYIAERDPGVDDETVLSFSRESNAILLTGDKDFGDLVFRQRLVHTGIVLMRLGGLTSEQKCSVVAAAFDLHGEALSGQFAVLSDRLLRIRSLLPAGSEKKVE
jgi:predicted nuclease of predicted toxin-antitoxin system